jgi:excisionase family DNA binding protein
MTIPNGDEWLTVQDAAKLSGYHAEYVRLLIREGKLMAKKFGPLWAVSKFSLLAYLDIAQNSDDGRLGPKVRK